MTNVELFVQKIFGVDLTEKQLHFQNTSDRTLWYKVKYATRTMYVPGMNVLRINPMELDRFIGYVDSVLHFGLDSPMYKWDNLNLYEYHGEEEVEAGLRLLIGNYSHALMGVDIETRDVSWDNNKLLAIGFAVDDNTCLAFYDIPQHLYPLLEQALNMPGATYVWHNGKFDCEHLWYTCRIKAHVDEDTMLKHYVQISEKKGSHGLKDLGPIYLQAPQWDDELDAYKKKWCREHKIKIADFKYDMIPTNILIPYMQRDCIATRRLLTVFEQLKEEGTDWIYRQLIKASNTFRCIECNGATVDQEHLATLDKELSADLQAATDDVNESIAYFWNPVAYSQETGAKYKEEFSLKSPKQLKWLLSKATGMQLESTDAATIDKLVEIAEEGVVKFDQHTIKLLEGIKRSRKASKYLDTYVIGIRNVLCSDGKVRANYNLHGTETGRLSSSNPNAQNIPRDKKIKNIFKAPKGYKLVQLDYSQCIAKGTRVNGVPIEQHSNAVYKGVSIVGTITTKRGYTVVCTPDHKILTDTGWKEASKLTEQDYIALQSEDTDCVDQSALYRFEGFWVGDGAFNGNNATISVARKGKYEGGVRTIITAAGFKVGYESKTSLGVKCGNTKYVNYLLERYNKKCLRIPEDLEYYENRSKLASFLGGLFDADGTVVTSTISVATAQYQFAQDIQRCLLYFGVMSTITKEHGGYNFVEGGKDYWRVQISDAYSINQFNNLIGFSLQEKREKVL